MSLRIHWTYVIKIFTFTSIAFVEIRFTLPLALYACVKRDKVTYECFLSDDSNNKTQFWNLDTGIHICSRETVIRDDSTETKIETTLACLHVFQGRRKH